MVLGYFGKTPVSPDPEVVKLAEEQLGLPPTTEKVLVLNDADPSKGIPAATKVLEDEGLPVSDENIFIAATCKEKGIRFLQGKAEVGVRKIDPNAASEAPVASPTESGKPAEYVVSVDGKNVFMAFEGNMVTVEGRVYRVGIKPQAGGSSTSSAADSSGDVAEVTSQMPGAVFKVLSKPGDRVKSGEPVRSWKR